MAAPAAISLRASSAADVRVDGGGGAEAAQLAGVVLGGAVAEEGVGVHHDADLAVAAGRDLRELVAERDPAHQVHEGVHPALVHAQRLTVRRRWRARRGRGW